jgi:type I restriction enzyme S subunit
MKEDWTYKRLGDVAYYPTQRVSSELMDETNYVGVDNMIKDRGGKTLANFIPSEGNAIQYLKGDILLGNIRPYLKKIWLSDSEGGASGDVLIIRPKDTKNLCPNYLYWVLASDMFFEYDTLHCKGAKMPRGNKDDIMKYQLPVPTIEAQQQIVSELELLSFVIEKQKAQIEELDKLAQSTFYDMFGDPVTNDKGWDLQEFGKVYKLKSGDGLSAKQFEEGPYPVYGGNGISGYHNAYNLEGNFVIIGRVGVYCGNVRNVSGQFWLTDNAFQLFYDKSLQNPVFVTYLLTCLNLHQYANHAAQPVISNTTLRDIDIIFPPLALQQEFAAKIEAIEQMKAKVRQSLKESEELFNSRMDYYFN